MSDLALSLAEDNVDEIFCASAASCMLRMDEESMGTATADSAAITVTAIKSSVSEKPGSPGFFTFSFVMRKTSPLSVSA